MDYDKYAFYLLSKIVCQWKIRDSANEEEKAENEKILEMIEGQLEPLQKEFEAEWKTLLNKEDNEQ